MAKRYELRLGANTKNMLDGGICLDEETSLDMGQSPFLGLMNMNLDNGGILSKRDGQAYVFPSHLTNLPVNCIYSNYQGYSIIHAGTKLYKYRNLENPIRIGETEELSNNRSCMFVYNGILYIMDGANYKCFDGKDLTEVTGYIPRVSMNRKPDGSSSVVDESWNMLTSLFKNTFNADGTSKDYKLSLDNLDPDSVLQVSVTVNGITKSLNTDFTVNLTTGTISFISAPAKGDNNVEIVACKTFLGLKSNILKCKFAIEFSNRIFIGGNPNLPTTYFASGLNEESKANYFPQKYLYNINRTSRPVTGFTVQYNKLIIFKEDCCCTVTASTGLDNTASFPISYLNTEIGCDIPNSIQLIENNIMFANTYGGVFVITSTQIADERNINCISQNINGDKERKGLLSEVNLKNATSVDHDFKYYLSLGDRCYVLDYRYGFSYKNQKENKWFLFDNIKANCFGIVNEELVYGLNWVGNLVKFIPAKTDFGNPIKAYWKSKIFDFGYPDWLKMITNIWVTFSISGTNSTIKVNFINEKGIKENEVLVDCKKLFSWANFSWNNFSWKVNVFDSTIKKKVRAKKIAYFQIEFNNDRLYEDLSIKNLVVEYRLQRKVR